MCGPRQSDGNPTLDVTTRPRLGLSPICGHETGYPLHGICRLHTQKSIHQGNKGEEVPALLEACLKVNSLLLPLRVLQALLRGLFRMVLGISVHDTHVMNTVSPIIPEVTD